MQTLDAFIAQLQKLQEQGHGPKPVFYRHGASGDCGPLGSAFITNHVDGQGSFGLEEGAEYISVYAGN